MTKTLESEIFDPFSSFSSSISLNYRQSFPTEHLLNVVVVTLLKRLLSAPVWKYGSSNKAIFFQNHQKNYPTHHPQDWLSDHYIISRELTPVWRNVVPIGWQEKRRPGSPTAEIPRGFLHLVATTTVVSTGYSFNMEVGLPRCHHHHHHHHHRL